MHSTRGDFITALAGVTVMPSVQITQSTPQFRVSIVLTIEEAGARLVLASALSEALRRYKDVVVTDDQPQFCIRVIGVKVTDGVCFSTTLTKGLTPVEALRCARPKSGKASDGLYEYYRDSALYLSAMVQYAASDQIEAEAKELAAFANVKMFEPIRKAYAPRPGIWQIP